MKRVRRRPALESLAAFSFGAAIFTAATTDWEAVNEKVFCHSPSECRTMFGIAEPNPATFAAHEPTTHTIDAD